MVTGTGTEIGKTWVGAAALRTLRAGGHTVAARKPLQSFVPGEGPTDAEILATASGEEPMDVCRPEHGYAIAMAPPMAAAALGASVPTIAALADQIDASWPERAVDVGLVEGAGGLASPLASDGDALRLIDVLRPDLTVVVAGAELGTINLVRLCVAALGARDVLVHLNRWDPAVALHQANVGWLREVDGFRVTTSVSDVADAIVGSGP